MKKLYRCLSLVLPLMLTFASVAHAQEGTSSGEISDENGTSMLVF